MTVPTGEGAMSTGPLVPLVAAGTAADARAVVALLEAHQIPAVYDAELDFADRPLTSLTKRAGAQVLVPKSLLSAARELLNRPEAALALVVVRAAEEKPDPVLPPEPAALDILDTPTEEVRIRLPEPSPLEGRLFAALAAIGFGTGLQRLLELIWDKDWVVSRLGARSPLAAEPWRLVSAGFVHGDPSHFLSNGAFGLLIGVVLFGTHLIGATMGVWLLASMVGLGAEVYLSTGALVIGASAGNYGLLGLWARGQIQRAKVDLLPRREILRTLGFLLLLAPGALTPFSATGTRIAVFAHVMGFLVGFVAGGFFERRLLVTGLDRISRRSRWAAVASVMTLLVSVSAAWLVLR